MRRKVDQEGYLIIDHRASPGISKEQAKALWKAGHPVIAVPEGTFLEMPTLTCGHCGTARRKNRFRIRERGHCRKCDHYICDWCQIKYRMTDECLTKTKRLDLVGQAIKRLGII